MHIPDAFLPLNQAVLYWIVAVVFIILSLRWARREMGEEKVPLVAVLAAGIFSIQTLNMALPIAIVPGGVSGHVVGAALAAIVLGSPFAGVFILTLVLLLQAILFGDGGITVMGANIINMGVLGGFFGFYTFRSLNGLLKNQFGAALVAGWVSLFIPAVAAAVELALAGTFPLTVGLITMSLYHAVIGIIEGGATAFALLLITAARPDIVEQAVPSQFNRKKEAILATGIVLALAIAVAAPFVASTYPDGLESAFYGIYGAKDLQSPLIDDHAAELAEQSIAERSGNDFSWSAPLQEYRIPGMDTWGEVIAIMVGVLCILFLGYGITRLTTREK
jgi:cobalt/nickel transport system permease protein